MIMSEIISYKDLRVWQLGIEIVKQVYLSTKGFLIMKCTV